MANEDQESDGEKLMVMRTEYEKYKDLWGLNIHFSHSAGATKNYSKFGCWQSITKFFVSARKNGLDLQMVHIYFDTPTFDRVERDVKVTN